MAMLFKSGCVSVLTVKTNLTVVLLNSLVTSSGVNIKVFRLPVITLKHADCLSLFNFLTILFFETNSLKIMPWSRTY